MADRDDATEAAMDAYSDAIRAEYGEAPSPAGRERNRVLLHANPAIGAMLAAHKRAVAEEIATSCEALIAEQYAGPDCCCREGVEDAIRIAREIGGDRDA